MRNRIRGFIANAALLFASIVFCVAATELVLRFAYPRYASAADSQLGSDALRIWAPSPNRRSTLPHPDTGARHAIIYNDLALRQSRSFSDLDSATNIGFFGDSYTTNLALPSAYSFTEPLDYLLNKSGQRYNVLNFGVNGYGTDQAYLHYIDSQALTHLDYVFYVLCANDLRNIFETGLFALDDAGMLVRQSVPQSPWWVKLVSRLHVTYFALDLRQRILYSRTGGLEDYRRGFEQMGMRRDSRERLNSPPADRLQTNFLNGVEDEDVSRVVEIFKALIEQWKQSTEANGAKFYVVLLPTGREEVFKDFISDDVPVVSLYDAIKRKLPDFDFSDVQFENDGHWNEEGNKLAAIELYEFLEREFGLDPLGEDGIERALETYYAAISSAGAQAANAAGTDDHAAAETADIRRTYLALEL